MKRNLRYHLLTGILLLAIGLTPFIATQTARAAGGKLVWSIEGISELSTLDPAKATDSQSFLVINFLYGRLVKLDKDLKVTPDLAAKWDISADGLTYTFPLRDVKFSDGTPITADDVIYSLNYAFDPNVGGSQASYYLGNIVGTDDFVKGKTKSIAGATAPDAKTVVLKVASPSAVFLQQLTFGFWVISKAQASASKDWASAPVASGGFKVKEWKHNQGITVVPNAGYWNAPSIDEIDFQFYQNSETAFQLYRQGKLDIMGSQQNGVPIGDIPLVKGKPDFKQAESFATRFIGFNNKVPPFDNVNVRRAFALAVDKGSLATKALGGAVTPADRILPTGMPGSDLSITPLKFDPAAAKKALADSGFTAQTLPKVTITYGTEGDNERVLTFLQNMWKTNLGVTVKLEPMELAKFSDTLTATFQDPLKGGIQAYYSIWGADYPDPQNFLSQQLHTDVGNNNGHWSDTDFDKLTDQADVLLNDDTARFKLYQQAEQIAIDKVGWLPIFFPKLNALVRPEIQGVIINGNGIAVPDYSVLKGR
ncbi:MAG TPA: peptide ABC transporter substrate-binding protein [Aggregatilineales bacterium]|nr:peptide ABC transporter substrate-binding protein [Aggregatilineales bacterium]